MGRRESETITPAPSVNLHLSLKDAPKSEEHSLGESGLTAKPQPPPLPHHGPHRAKVRLPQGRSHSCITRSEPTVLSPAPAEPLTFYSFAQDEKPSLSSTLWCSLITVHPNSFILPSSFIHISTP